MMNEDSKKRLKAIAEALAADMLMEAANLIEDAADLLVQVSFLLRDKDIEADSCFPCCVVEVYCDDEL